MSMRVQDVFGHFDESTGKLVSLRTNRPDAGTLDLTTVPAKSTWSGRPLSGNSVGDRFVASDIGAGAMFVWDGTRWRPDGGTGMLIGGLLLGAYSNVSATGGGNTLIALPGGAPLIYPSLLPLGGLVIIAGFGQKLGSAGAINPDFRLGTGNNLSDSFHGGFGAIALPNDGDLFTFRVEIKLTSPTTVTSTTQYRKGSTDALFSSGSQSININSASGMYANVGYNSATGSDGLLYVSLEMRLF